MQPAPANSPTKCLPPVCRCDPAEGGDAIRLTTVGRPRRLRVRLTQCEHSCSYCGFDAAASLTQSGQKNAMSASRPVDDCGRLQIAGRLSYLSLALRLGIDRLSHSPLFSGDKHPIHKARFIHKHETEPLLGGKEPAFG